MNSKENKINNLKLLPMLFMIAIVPLIVYLKPIELQGDNLTFWTGVSTSYDFFSYYKMLFIIIGTSVCTIIFIYDLIRKNIKLKKHLIYVPMVVYAAFIVISTLLSEHKEIALFGFVERYEGMIVLLCYIIILFIAMNYIQGERQLKYFLGTLLASAAIIGIIGLFQYLGMDFLKSDLGKKLMLPKEYHSAADSLSFEFGKNTIYATLYHYNYVGSYMAMLFPLTLALGLFIKNKIAKIIMILMSVLMFINWIGSNSRAGIIGGVLAIIFLLVLIRKKILEHWKVSLGILGLCIVLALGLNIISDGKLFDRVISIAKNITGTAEDGGESSYDNIKVEGNRLIIDDKGNKFIIETKDLKLTFKDGNDNELKYTMQDGVYYFEDEKYKDYQIQLNPMRSSDEDQTIFTLVKGNMAIRLINRSTSFEVLTDQGQILKLDANVESWGFEGKEKLGSARGYIWSRSLPLLKDTLVKGYGPDTFAMYFPQHDYLGKLKAYNTASMLVDKPHNLYLQIALSTGVISLIAFLAMILMYVASAFKVLFNNKFEDIYSICSLAIFVAIIGYLGAGIFNDSVVSVAPVFWALFGTGIALNIKLDSNKVK